MTEQVVDSAPEEIRWCCRCRSELVTRPIGGKPRRACPACGWIYFVEAKVAVGVCVVRDQEILLVQRKFAPQKNKWSVPAGYLDRGDEPRAHAAREVLEETGLEVSIDGLIDVFYNPPSEGGASILLLYRGALVGGQIAAADDAIAAGFFGVDELPPLAFASTRHAIAMLAGQLSV